ncbi:hypothetical protein AR457_35830 [Streptomyces agglomeratus]|nr:hypothetical protein AR457_35830 [Streptomyces agglomeratus]OEJ36622.1 hypothetical protein BGK72_36210 [Streptomyces agglomeratus]OEJ56341.1 hypothetical protein BGM19_37095 [Streptomyces agglomeratus]
MDGLATVRAQEYAKMYDEPLGTAARLDMLRRLEGGGVAPHATAAMHALRFKTLRLTIKTVSRPEDAQGFVILPRRWVVEKPRVSPLPCSRRWHRRFLGLRVRRLHTGPLLFRHAT